MKLVSKLAVVGIFFLIIGSAHAATITFDNATLPNGQDYVFRNGDIYSEAGYNVQSNAGTYNNFIVIDTLYEAIDGKSLLFGNSNSITITAADAGIFDFTEVSYSIGNQIRTDSNSFRLYFYGDKESGMVNTYRDFGLGLFTSNDFGNDFIDLKSLRIASYFSNIVTPLIDNIEVSPSAVPVPAAFWLLASGCAVLFGVNRKKRI